MTELFVGRFVYASLFGYHPFQHEGEMRYWGSRPLLLFEDANQIGMWWATIALAVVGLYPWQRNTTIARRLGLSALLLTPFLFQAIGGSLLTLFGTAVLMIRRRWMVAIVAAMIFVGTIGYVFRGPILRTGRHWAE